MVKLCLISSHGCPPGLVLHTEQGMSKVIKDLQRLLPSPGGRREIIQSGSLNLRPHQGEEPWNRISGLSESNQLLKIDSPIQRPVLIDVQDARPDSVLFSFGIAEQCTRHEKILQFLMSGSSEVESGELDLSLLSDLMGLQALRTDVHQRPFASSDGSCHHAAEAQPSLIYPRSELHAQKPLLDFVGDLACNSKVMVHPDGRVSFTGTGTEIKYLLSVVAEFYLSKNSTKRRKHSILVPHFKRLGSSEVQANILGSSLTLETLKVAPLKSPEKVKLKPSPKKKNCKKAAKERDLFKKNYFHACESLLSLLVDKHGKTAILSLKKSGPELPQLLTQFSAGIAGTGLAVLFSVICKVACGRVPFCASRIFNTGFGFGLVWLSWAVNRLTDTIVYVTKNSGKLGLKEEEIMRRVDRSVNEIFFRTAMLMAVAVLRLA